MAILAYGSLAAVWISRYRSGHAPVVVSVLEAALIFTTAVTAPDPAAVFIYMFASLWLRSLYGTTRGALLHTAFVSVAVLVALAAFSWLPGRGTLAQTSVVGMLNAIPVMFLTVAVARNLARSLFAREESQRRDAALVRLGHRLIGVADRAEIRRIACECARAVCEATSGLRLLVVLTVDGNAVVVEAVGEMREAPHTVPTSVLPARGSAVSPLPDVGPLRALTSVGTWLGVALGDETGGWVLIGARSRVPGEAVVAIRSMCNQVALALTQREAAPAAVTGVVTPITRRRTGSV